MRQPAGPPPISIIIAAAQPCFPAMKSSSARRRARSAPGSCLEIWCTLELQALAPTSHATVWLHWLTLALSTRYTYLVLEALRPARRLAVVGVVVGRREHHNECVQTHDLYVASVSR